MHDMLNNSLCLYIWVIHIWITFPNDILVELSTKYFASQTSPHMTFVSLPTEYASNLKVVACWLTICQKELIVLNLLQTKKILGQPTNAFSLHWWHLGHLQTYTMMASPLASAPLHLNHTCLCTQQKMQHNVVLGQVIMPNSIMMYYIHNVL